MHSSNRWKLLFFWPPCPVIFSLYIHILFLLLFSVSMVNRKQFLWIQFPLIRARIAGNWFHTFWSCVIVAPRRTSFRKPKPVSYCPIQLSLLLIFKFNRISSNCSHSWFAMHDLFLRKTSDAEAGLFTKVKSYYELTRHSIISIVSPV